MDIPQMKIMTILGTRPEIIRLSRVIPKLDMVSQHTVVYTNQNYNYELSGIFFDEMQIRKPDVVLDVKAATLGEQIGNILTQTEKVLHAFHPDAVLILGDTNSALSAIIAKRMKIPVFHMEAGNRCFDKDVPEELNRKIVDHISDYNLAYTQHARTYLLREGLLPQNIIVTGSPLSEVFNYYGGNIEKNDALIKYNLQEKEYVIVSSHREENIENQGRMDQLIQSLSFIQSFYKKRILVSLHPRTKTKISENEWKDKGIELFKPFSFFEYANLERHAFCVLSDSGTIQEESAILGFPAIQIRYSTERPEAFDAGSIVVCGMNKQSIMASIELIRKFTGNSIIPTDYKDCNVSDKVARFIIGTIGKEY